MLDNLLKPMRKMKIDINEFAAAKAIFFLNPGLFRFKMRVFITLVRNFWFNIIIILS